MRFMVRSLSEEGGLRIYVQNKQLHLEIDLISRKPHISMGELPSSRFHQYDSIQISHISSEKTLEIFVNGDFILGKSIGTIPEVDMIDIRNQRPPFAGGLYFYQHSTSGAESKDFLIQYESTWPKEKATEWLLPAIIGSFCAFVMLSSWLVAKFKSADTPRMLPLLHVSLGLLDFTTDYQMAYRLLVVGDDYAYITIALLAGAWICSIVYLLRWYKEKLSYENTLSHWLVKQKTYFMIAMALSGSNIGMINVMWSGLYTPYLKDKFLMPIKKQDAHVLTSGKIISIFLEDLPFLYIQYAVLSNIDESDEGTQLATQLALAFSLLSIFVGMISYFGRFGSDYKALRKQYVIVHNPKRNLLNKSKSIVKKFKKAGYEDSFAWVSITQVSKSDFRLCFEYTHVPNVCINEAVMETIKHFSNHDTEIHIQNPPKVTEFIEDIAELANLLAYEDGVLELEDNDCTDAKSKIKINFEAIDEDMMADLLAVFGKGETRIEKVVDLKIQQFVSNSYIASSIKTRNLSSPRSIDLTNFSSRESATSIDDNTTSKRSPEGAVQSEIELQHHTGGASLTTANEDSEQIEGSVNTIVPDA